MQLLASDCGEPDERPPMSDAFWVQYVLDTCSSLDDVVRAATELRLHQSECQCHYLVCDEDGSCLTIEFLEGELVVHRGETLPVKALTNMPYGRALAALERGGARWWESNPGQSAQRFAAAAARNAAFDPGGETSAEQYMFDTLTRFVVVGHTRWNIAYHVAKRAVWFRSRKSPGVKHFSLSSFDLGCQAPLLMLDMSAPLEGDVTSSFQPYDRALNARIFRAFCDGWGIEVTDESTVRLMDIFDGFDCAGGGTGP